MLGEVAWQDELDGGLDIAGADGLLSLVSVQLAGLEGDLLEKVGDEGVHDVHGLLGDSDFTVDVLKHSVDVDAVAAELLSSDSLDDWLCDLLCWSLAGHCLVFE